MVTPMDFFVIVLARLYVMAAEGKISTIFEDFIHCFQIISVVANSSNYTNVT